MGQPKAWLPFGPERLLQRVVRLLATVADPVLVVAAQGQDLPDLPASVPVVRDAVADQGPLGGLATGLAALAETVELVYVSGTDAPLLQPAWVDRLVESIGDADLIVPDLAGRLHPLAALYRRQPVLDAARTLLEADQRRLTLLIDRVRGRTVGVEIMAAVDPHWQTLRNLNTPEEYQQALRDAGMNAEERS